MGLLGLNILGDTVHDEPGLLQFIGELKPSTVVVMDKHSLAVQIRQTHPNTRVIYRFFSPNDGQWHVEVSGSQWVKQFAHFASNGIILQAYNEPDSYNREVLGQVVQWCVEAMAEASLHGIKLCLPNLGMGHPSDDPERIKELDAFLFAFKDHPEHILGLHEYSKGVAELDGGWLIGRFPRVLKRATELGVTKLRVVVTEYGRDVGGGMGANGDGWRNSGMGEVGYFDFLTRGIDKYYRAFNMPVCIYCYGTGGGNDWVSYDIQHAEELKRRMILYAQGNATISDLVTPLADEVVVPPVPSDATHFSVTAAVLNLRSAPMVSVPHDANVIAKMPNGTIVEKLNYNEDATWMRVSVTIDDTVVQGWASTRFLEPVGPDFAAGIGLNRFFGPGEGGVDEPAWLTIARDEIGVKGMEGAGNNPRIIEYFGETTLGNTPYLALHGDEVAWCSAFVNWVIAQAGMNGTNNGFARSWLTWQGGVRLDEPRLGCITIFKRLNAQGIDDGKLGHVGFFIGKENGRITVLGGNQQNEVNIKSYNEADLLGYRYPITPLAAPLAPANGLNTSGRFYEPSLTDLQTHIGDLQTELNATEDVVERARLAQALQQATAAYESVKTRAAYTAPVPPTHPSSGGGRANWRKAWAWSFHDGDILDATAPYNDALVRVKPGELSGENIERVIAFLNVENTDRYDPVLHNTEGRLWELDLNEDGTNTMCTVFAADATRILSAEIPLQPNRAANVMVKWLEDAAARGQEWKAFATPEEAQDWANQGKIAVVARRNPAGAGHVALVRPVPVSEDPVVPGTGPYIAQAGATNSSCTRVSEIFGTAQPADVRFRTKYFGHA